MSSDLLHLANEKLNEAVTSSLSEPGIPWSEYDYPYIYIRFPKSDKYAKHSIYAEAKNEEKILIHTWVVTSKENYGYPYETIEVTNADDFVSAILALGEKVTKTEVAKAYQTMIDKAAAEAAKNGPA